MYSHTDIWRAIDRLAQTFGYSPSGLAKKAGLDPTTFNKSKRISADGKPRWPSTESIAKILAITGITMIDFFGMSDQGHAKEAGRTIPLLGYAQAGRSGYFDEAGYPTGQGWDQITFPTLTPQINDDTIYALKVSGNSMEPLYREGDVLIIAPQGPVHKGDRIVVHTAQGEVMAKELVKQTMDRLDLRSLNEGHKDLSLKTADISWIGRILWVSQ